MGTLLAGSKKERILPMKPRAASLTPVVEAEGSRMRLINYGCIETKAGVPMQDRLRALQLGIRDVLSLYHPDEVAFEELFFSHNVTTALMVGAAR